ncbi:ABC transporter substrate-binding protein [Actinopolymorpha pittospori]
MTQIDTTQETSDPRGSLSRRAFLWRTAVAGAAAGPLLPLLTACEGEGAGGGGAPGPGGAGGGGVRARTVVFDFHGGRVQSPDLWNPLVPGFTVNAGFHQALMEPLFILDYESGETEPWLGESFTPDETSTVWTLKVRDGIQWSDGEDYDADDIVFTINLLLKGGAELNNAAAMKDWVKSVEKVDKTSVRFTLNRPNPRFQLDYFSVKIHGSLAIVPQHVWEGEDPAKFKNYEAGKSPVFTGPYRLTSASPTKFTYERRADWWGAKTGFMPLPKPERLEWVVSETEDIRVARASDHQLDSVADLTAGAFESLRARNPEVISWLPAKPYAWPDPCTRLFSLNNAVAPWNDREMRWAVNHALDRDEIVRIAYEGTTTPARFFFPDYPPMQEYVDLIEKAGLFEEFPIARHDPDEAKRIIESKGYTRSGEGYYTKDGKELRIQIDAPTDFIEIWRYAEVIGEQLQRVGINATVRKLAGGIWGDNLNNGRFEGAADWSACGSVTEPWFSMQLFQSRAVVPVGKGSTSNAVRWKNDDYSRSVDQIANLPLGDPGIEKPFLAAARVWLRDLPFLPVAHARKLYAFDTTYWTGWATQKDNYLQPTLDWGNAHKIIHRLRPTNAQ